MLLVWAYVVLVAGAVSGLVNFRLRVASAVLMAATIGVWLAVRVIRGERVRQAGIELGVLLFLGAQLAAALFSNDVRHSVEVVSQYGAYVLIFYFALDWGVRAAPAELIEKTLLVAGGIVVSLALFDLVSIYQAWRGYAAGLPYAPPFRHRLFSVFGEANLLAAFVNLILPLALARRAATHARAPRVLLLILIVGALVTGLFASSRGGLLGTAAALVMLGLLWTMVVSPVARWRVQQVSARVRSKPVAMGALAVLAAVALVAVVVIALRFEGSATHSPVLDSRNVFWRPALQGLQQAPLFGVGPGRYAALYMQAASMPPIRPYMHAHSVPVNVAAESGLIGLVGLAALLLVVVRAVRRSVPTGSQQSRARWAGSVAALVGLATHSLVDDHSRFLAAAVPALALLALVLSYERSEANHRGGMNPIWLALAAVILALFAGYSLRAQALHERGMDAAVAGDWNGAARRFDAAAEADPGVGQYWLDSGFAHGVVALDGSAPELARAIVNTERGIGIEPAYAPNYANLAALYAQAGRTDAAVAMLEAVAAQAPRSYLYPLNAGVVAEAAGNDAAAQQFYSQALETEPTVAQATFWDATPLRRTVRNGWQAAAGADRAGDRLAGGEAALERGDLSGAAARLATAWSENPNDPRLYYDFGRLARTRGDLAAAEKYLQLAVWVQTQSAAEKIPALLELADLALTQGDSESAQHQFDFVMQAVTEYTVYGWGTYGWNPYALFVFQRRGLPTGVLPQVARADMSVAFLERLQQVAGAFAARGIEGPGLQVESRFGAFTP